MQKKTVKVAYFGCMVLAMAPRAWAQPQPGEADKPAASVETPADAKNQRSPVRSKWQAELYGFVELDVIHDSTQSFGDLAGNGAIARRSYAAEHQRTTFGVRNSRIGFKVKGPASDNVATSAILEMDFLGNQPSPVSEGAFIGSPTFRIRHFALKLETRLVDLLFGQYWQLFGWQSTFHPSTVEIQGVPGQIYSRAPQIRLQRKLGTDALGVELAVAAGKPAQRDSSIPDGQAGARLILNHWKGLHTAGSTGTAIDGASVGVSGIVRHFAVPEFADKPVASKTRNGSGISIDALVPVIPAEPDNRGNSLTLTGSFVRGTGIADLYTGLTGGLTFAPLPSGGAYAANVDNGLVGFDASLDLHTINWLSYMAGVQYYLPPSGKIWLSANFSGMKSTNMDVYGAAAKVFNKAYWADGNLFVDVDDAVRFGAEVAWFRQEYLDGVKAHNYRGQFSAFYLF